MRNHLSFDIKEISTYRSELMGWSILWIMMLHFTFTQIAPLGFVAQYGFAGVDIFMMVSGLGLFYSLDKDDNVLRFYKKRLLRIFPTYYIIGFFDNIIVEHDGFLTYLFRYTTIGYWTGQEYAGWFIPAIIFLYLLAPLIKFVIDKKWFVLTTTAIVLIYLSAYFFADKENILDRSHFFLLYRIPAFIFGMVLAYWIKNGKSVRWYYYVLLAGMPFFIWLFPQHHQVYNFKYFSLAFLLPVFTICFILLSKYASFIKYKSSIKHDELCIMNYALKKMGQASLEIYLIQGIFFTLVLNGKTEPFAQWHDLLTIGMIIASTTLGIAAHWLIDKLGIQRLLK